MKKPCDTCRYKDGRRCTKYKMSYMAALIWRCLLQDYRPVLEDKK